MWAIVPIKTFERAKQRLADVLSPAERRALMLAMARDVLTSLSKSRQLSGVLIVSRAPEAEALAQSFATERFAESPNADLATALTQATEHLINHFGAQVVFVIPADVPNISADEVAACGQFDHDAGGACKPTPHFYRMARPVDYRREPAPPT